MTITGDTDPNNPVHTYPANTFPIGAALTVAYGGTTRMFCTLGNLYRLLGYLYGDVPAHVGVPDADPPILALDDVVAKYREHVLAALPDELKAIDPPPADADNDVADVAWVTGIGNKYGHTVSIPPTPETPTQSR